MAASKETLVNRGLSLFGEPPILTLGQNDQAGKSADLIYETTRQALFREHTWNCVTKRATLAQHADAPDFGYTRQFVLPSGWMRNVKVNDGKERYKVELSNDNKRVILTDVSSIELIFVADIDDPALYDALLIEVFVRRLAQDLCYPITKDIELTRIMRKDYQDALDDAKTVNAQDRAHEEFLAEDFLDARLGDDSTFRAIESP
jgi:hypothetical protein